MRDVHEGQLEELGEPEMVAIRGGGGPELGHDMGYLVGAAVGLFMRIGESFYRSGGLTGTNAYLRA